MKVLGTVPLGEVKLNQHFKAHIQKGEYSLDHWWDIGPAKCYRTAKGFMQQGDPDPFVTNLIDSQRRILVDLIEAEKPNRTAMEYLRARINSATGTDPEIFVTHGEKGTLYPAYKFLPVQPTKTSAATWYAAGSAHRDGFAGELLVNSSGCHSWVVDGIQQGLKDLLKLARKADPTAKLSHKSAMLVPQITMTNAKEEDVALGCMPSFNAYGEPHYQPANPRKVRMRFAGGHIHFDVPGKTREKYEEMVKACDVMVAIPAVAIFANLDVPARRQHYGRAGEFRLPSHGLEYRTLSNGWLLQPAVSHLIFNLSRIALKVGYNGYRNLLGMPEDKARDIINNCDWEQARKWSLDNVETFAKLLNNDGVYTDVPTLVKSLKNIIGGGLEEVFPDFKDIEKSWNLNGNWTTHSEGREASWANLCKTRAW